MSDSTEATDALLTVLLALVMISSLGLSVWFGLIKPVRTVKGGLAKLEGPLALTSATTKESAWPATRDQFMLTSWPMVKGTRGEFHVEVTMQPPVRWLSTSTTVVVSGRPNVGGRVLVSRQPEVLAFSKNALNPFSKPLVSRPETLQAFVGNANVYYDKHQLPRLFGDALRSELAAFPRHWLNLGFDHSSMMIAWWGMEEDPAVIERAFTIAMTSLRLIGTSSR